MHVHSGCLPGRLAGPRQHVTSDLNVLIQHWVPAPNGVADLVLTTQCPATFGRYPYS
jgi:hypothetical protein